MPFPTKPSAIQKPDAMPPLELAESGGRWVITGTDFRLTFDKQAGRLTSFIFQETELLAGGPRLNAWRAPTDNDGFKAHPHRADKLLGRWLQAGFDRLESRPEVVTIQPELPQVVRISVQSRVQAPDLDLGFSHQIIYTLYGSGDLLIENTVGADPGLPPLPRIGLTMALPGGFEQFSWYGRGPHESYVDRKAGVAVGLYRGVVDAQYVPYIMPQENGNKTDVRWLTLANEAGLGLLAVGDPPLEASVSHYRAADLYRAYHTNELIRREKVILNLDYRQSGLGGASCGPGTLPQYLIRPGTFRFTIRLRPFGKDERPAHLARQEFQTG
jgi:hypothetical protein